MKEFFPNYREGYADLELDGGFFRPDSILARDLRSLIIKKLEEGKSEKEITNYLVDRYGEFILFKPKFSANTYILWLSPIFIILFGLFLIKGIFRKS